MPAIIITRINNQNNKAITQTNIKPATFSPMKHIVVSSMQMYCIGIQNGLSVGFIACLHFSCHSQFV